jgi:hypothetical protein
MAWMHVDVLALQEILATPDAEFSLNALRADLNRLTGGSWQYAWAKTPIGVDFHILSVHFDSGTTGRDYTHRR